MKTKIEFISQLSRRIVKEECTSDKKVEFVKSVQFITWRHVMKLCSKLIYY